VDASPRFASAPPPRAAIALGLPLIAAGISFGGVTWWLLPMPAAVHTGMVAAVLAAFCAVFAGVPAAYWAFTTGRLKLYQWMALGMAAGAVPGVVVLAGGMLGAVVRGDTAAIRQGPAWLVSTLLELLGVPLVLVRATSFVGLELLPACCGGVTGAAFWLLVVRTSGRRTPGPVS
jgi:hypothetical protein